MLCNTCKVTNHLNYGKTVSMKHSSRPLFCLLTLTAFALSGCGFEPMHATRPDATGSRTLLPIEIGSVTANEDRSAQIFRMAIEDLVDPALKREGQPYILTAGIGAQRTPVFIRPDGTIARYNISITVSYVLTRASDRVNVAAGNLRYVNSYNVPDSEYAEYVGQQDATKRGLEQLAEDLRLRLAGFLARKPDERSQTPVNPLTPAPQMPSLGEIAPIVPKNR